LRSVCWICLFQSSLIHFQSGRPSKADAWYFPHLVFHRRIHFWRHFQGAGWLVCTLRTFNWRHKIHIPQFCANY
jgi:hypothetical protein